MNAPSPARGEGAFIVGLVHLTGMVAPAAHDGQATPGQISCFWRRAPVPAWSPTGPPLLSPTEAGVSATISAPMPVCWPAECRGARGGFGRRRVGADAPPWRRRAAALASVAWARLVGSAPPARRAEVARSPLVPCWRTICCRICGCWLLANSPRMRRSVIRGARKRPSGRTGPGRMRGGRSSKQPLTAAGHPVSRRCDPSAPTLRSPHQRTPGPSSRHGLSPRR